VEQLYAHLCGDVDRFVLDSTLLDRPLRNIVTCAGSSYVPQEDESAYGLLSRINAVKRIRKDAFAEAFADLGYRQDRRRKELWTEQSTGEYCSVVHDGPQRGLVLYLGAGWMSGESSPLVDFTKEVRNYLDIVRDVTIAAYKSFNVRCPPTSIGMVTPKQLPRVRAWQYIPHSWDWQLTRRSI